MNIELKITIQVDDTELILSEDQAINLRNLLDSKLKTEPKAISVPNDIPSTSAPWPYTPTPWNPNWPYEITCRHGTNDDGK